MKKYKGGSENSISNKEQGMSNYEVNDELKIDY